MRVCLATLLSFAVCCLAEGKYVPAYQCITYCTGGTYGWYKDCGSCRNYWFCTGWSPSEQKTCGAGQEFDLIERRCLPSVTCATGRNAKWNVKIKSRGTYSGTADGLQISIDGYIVLEIVGGNGDKWIGDNQWYCQCVDKDVVVKPSSIMTVRIFGEDAFGLQEIVMSHEAGTQQWRFVCSTSEHCFLSTDPADAGGKAVKSIKLKGQVTLGPPSQVSQCNRGQHC